MHLFLFRRGLLGVSPALVLGVVIASACSEDSNPDGSEVGGTSSESEGASTANSQGGQSTSIMSNSPGGQSTSTTGATVGSPGAPAAVVGCSVDALDAVSIAPVSEADLLAEFPRLLCQLTETCCGEAGLPYDAATCEEGAAGYFQPEPSFVYDPIVGARCLLTMRQSAAIDFCAGGVSGACNAMYRGAVALGAACEEDDECASDARGFVRCDITDQVCTLETRAALGDPCSWSCENGGSSKSCGGGGGSLDVPDYIEANCWREDGLECLGGVCIALPGPGEDCSTSSLQCRANARCDQSTRKCVAVSPGAPCSQYECVAGEDCGGSDDPGSCQPMRSYGEACDDNDQCCSGFCLGTFCGYDSGINSQRRFDNTLCGAAQ